MDEGAQLTAIRTCANWDGDMSDGEMDRRSGMQEQNYTFRVGRLRRTIDQCNRSVSVHTLKLSVEYAEAGQ